MSVVSLYFNQLNQATNLLHRLYFLQNKTTVVIIPSFIEIYKSRPHIEPTVQFTSFSVFVANLNTSFLCFLIFLLSISSPAAFLSDKSSQAFISNEIYSTRKVRVPVPELYVFYNGIAEIPVEDKIKLSDSYVAKCDTIPVEAEVKIINVNYEKGAELLRRCRTLEEYSRFIHMIRENAKELQLKQAVEKSIDECVSEGMLKDFLKKNGGEIMGILCHELTREQCEAIRENDGYLRGLEEGEARGEAEAKKKIARNFKSAGLPIDIIAQNTGLTSEEIENL